MLLKGKIVIITGGTSGIGLAVSKRTLQEGGKIAILHVNKNKDKNVIRELAKYEGKYKLYRCDISNEDDVRKTFENVFLDFGRIDCLVNSAGVALENKPSREVTIDEWNKVISVNLTGVFLCTKYVIPYMIKKLIKQVRANLLQPY